MSNTITANTVKNVEIVDATVEAVIVPQVKTQDQLLADTKNLVGTLAATDDVSAQWLANLAVTFASTATPKARNMILEALPASVHAIAGGKGEAVAFQLATLGRFMIANEGDETITYSNIIAARKAVKGATGGKGGVAIGRGEIAAIVRGAASLADIPASIAAEMKLRKTEKAEADSLGETTETVAVDLDVEATPQEIINAAAGALNAKSLRGLDIEVDLTVLNQLVLRLNREQNALRASRKTEVAA